MRAQPGVAGPAGELGFAPEAGYEGPYPGNSGLGADGPDASPRQVMRRQGQGVARRPLLAPPGATRSGNSESKRPSTAGASGAQLLLPDHGMTRDRAELAAPRDVAGMLADTATTGLQLPSRDRSGAASPSMMIAMAGRRASASAIPSGPVARQWLRDRGVDLDGAPGRMPMDGTQFAISMQRQRQEVDRDGDPHRDDRGPAYGNTRRMSSGIVVPGVFLEGQELELAGFHDPAMAGPGLGDSAGGKPISARDEAVERARELQAIEFKVGRELKHARAAGQLIGEGPGGRVRGALAFTGARTSLVRSTTTTRSGTEEPSYGSRMGTTAGRGAGAELGNS